MTRAGRSSDPDGHRARTWAQVGYLVVLAFALLSPLAFRLDPGFLAERAARLFRTGVLTPGDMVDAVRNVVLFAGWGLLDVATDDGDSLRRRVARSLAGGALIGLTAELVQLALPARTPSLLDAAMNAGGAAIGAAVTDASMRRVAQWRGRATLLGAPALAIAVPYAAAVVLEAAFPLLRSEPLAGVSGGPVVRALEVSARFRWQSIAVLPWTDVLLFAPAGVLLAAAFREVEGTADRAGRWTVAAGVLIATLGELAHAPLGRPVQLGPLVLHAGAIGLGGVWATRSLPAWIRTRDGGARIRHFLALYVLVLVIWRVRPFVPELDPGAVLGAFSPSRWSPLSALAGRRELYTVSDILRSFLLFVPLGVGLAAREAVGSRGPRPALRAAASIAALALLLEGTQALVAGRFFDATDVLVAAAGGLVAWSITRRRAGP